MRHKLDSIIEEVQHSIEGAIRYCTNKTKRGEMTELLNSLNSIKEEYLDCQLHHEELLEQMCTRARSLKYSIPIEESPV